MEAGDKVLQELPRFTANQWINVDIPEDADELYFYKLFITDEIIDDITSETHLYAKEFLKNAGDDLSPSSDLARWPENGIISEKMSAFLALTYYFGIVKKDLLKSIGLRRLPFLLYHFYSISKNCHVQNGVL